MAESEQFVKAIFGAPEEFFLSVVGHVGTAVLDAVVFVEPFLLFGRAEAESLFEVAVFLPGLVRRAVVFLVAVCPLFSEIILGACR